MNKLQLYIYKSVRGFKSVRNINPSEDIQRHIRDVRNALEILDYDPSEKYLFYLLSYVDEGTFFTIIRTIPDKDLDHLATTIFIPNGLQIESDEFAAIVHRTTRMISNPSVSVEDLNELHEVFSKEYSVDPEAPSTVESQGREYAFSYYGGETGRNLTDFFGDMLYQNSFIKYAGVVLVDADLGVNVDATDLTYEPLCLPAVLLPPESSNGFTPYIYGRPFQHPFRVSLGETVEVMWRRNGFEDIRQDICVAEPVQNVEASSLDGSRKTITPSSFFITSQSSKRQIGDAEIIVNGVEITGAHSFSYDELKDADVVVRAHGHQPYHASFDLAATSQALIALPELRKIYRFEMPVKSSELGAPIRFEIHTKRQLSESPLEGYSLLDGMKEGAGRCNYLQYTGGGPGVAVRRCLLYILAALVAGFILGWAITRGNSSKSDSEQLSEEMEVVAIEEQQAPQKEQATVPAKEKVKEQPQEKPVENAPKPTSATAEGNVTTSSVAYLDNNATWTREELEKQPGLSGLFDDMNNFRIDRIISYWGPRLSNSKRFSEVAKFAAQGKSKGYFKPAGTYCSKPDDTSINVKAYTYRIDPAGPKKK